MFVLQCPQCLTMAIVEECPDPDALVVCPPDSDCCQIDHHHGDNARATGVACRPITITAGPGSLTVAPAIPGSV